jgi:hypothetical protein
LRVRTVNNSEILKVGDIVSAKVKGHTVGIVVSVEEEDPAIEGPSYVVHWQKKEDRKPNTFPVVKTREFNGTLWKYEV